MNRWGLVALCGIVAVAGCASNRGESVTSPDFDLGKYTKVGIVDVSGAVYGDGVKGQISDFVAMELMRKGYTVAARAEVQKLRDELTFQASDITSDQGAMRAGQILNVPAVLLVTIPKYGEKMSMTIKMLDVEQGNILWIGTGSASTGKSLGTFLGAAAGAALGAAVAGGDSGDRTLGAIAGGVGGGVAGHLLSPEEEEVVQKCIKDVCKDLPSHLVPAGSIRRP